MVRQIGDFIIDARQVFLDFSHTIFVRRGKERAVIRYDPTGRIIEKTYFKRKINLFSLDIIGKKLTSIYDMMISLLNYQSRSSI